MIVYVEYNSSDDIKDIENINDQTTITTATNFPFTENAGKSSSLEKDNGKSNDSTKNLSRKFCEICFTAMTQQEYGFHLCLNQVIECEYCTGGIFTTTAALRKHLSSAHADLQFYKCDKCILVFPMQKLLEIHKSTDQTHFDVACDDLAEVSSDTDESSMDCCEYEKCIERHNPEETSLFDWKLVFSSLIHPSYLVYGCQMCNISMSNPRELGLHMRYHHRPKPGSSLNLKVSEPANSAVGGKVPSERNHANRVHNCHFLSFLQIRPKRRKIRKNIAK